ncbi:hypothetical protein SLA2020_347200 [Shorea laevis]
MAPSVSINSIVLIITACILFYGTYLDTAAQFVAASAESSSASMELEAKALLESGWWGSANTNINTSSRCKWPGITCNAGGSVTEIVMNSCFYLGEMSKLNLSSFPNLVRLDLHETGLQGVFQLR